MHVVKAHSEMKQLYQRKFRDSFSGDEHLNWILKDDRSSNGWKSFCSSEAGSNNKSEELGLQVPHSQGTQSLFGDP